MMSLLLGAFGWFRSSRIGQFMAMIGGVLFVLWMAYLKGGRNAVMKQRVANLEGYIDVTKRGEEAAVDAARRVGALSDSDLNKRLHKSGALRD